MRVQLAMQTTAPLRLAPIVSFHFFFFRFLHPVGNSHSANAKRTSLSLSLYFRFAAIGADGAVIIISINAAKAATTGDMLMTTSRSADEADDEDELILYSKSSDVCSSTRFVKN